MSGGRGWQPSALALRALAIARSQLAVLEDPLGSNRGPLVDQYLKSVGLGPGHEWCQAFVYWCFREAALELGVATPLPKVAAVIKHWNEAPAACRYTAAQVRRDPDLVQRGMLVVLDRGKGKGHIGFVDYCKHLHAPDRYALFTFEGNINPEADPGREGWGVFPNDRRTLDDDELLGMIGYATPPTVERRVPGPRANSRRRH
jgi:hypothetical protein